MELDLSGRAVLVAGAASDLGRACALALAREGARLGLLDTDASAAAGLARRLSVECGVQCFWAVTDIAEEAEVRAAVESMAARLDGIDAVVVAAGGRSDPDAPGTSATELDHALRANVRGPFLLVEHAARHLSSADHPTVVLIGPDAAGLRTLAYHVAKGAMQQLIRALCAELGDKGVRINGIHPLPAGPAVPRIGAGPATWHRHGGAGKPASFTASMLWLVSPGSAAVNGTSTVCGSTDRQCFSA